ncbi:MAG: 50S ribosomal protein L31e [Promethearchaeota archaeon]|nr:MAG: 50S ribosomal protein L31e [Candidatus Lokiarchaeota archaeon]
MAKKRKEISLDDLEEELAEEGEGLEEIEEEEAEIEEIEEFSLEEISAEEEVEELFEEEIVPEEEIVEEERIPEEEIIDERIYTVPLKKARRGPRTKWAKKSIRYLREFTQRHMKPEYLVISQEVNEKVWSRGIQKPPRKLRVRITKDINGLAVVYLA